MSETTHCRIGKVTPIMKILPKKSNIEDYRKRMHNRVDTLCDNCIGYDEKNPNLSAMAIVVIGADGSYNAVRHIEENAGFGGKLFPAILSEVFRLENIESLAEEIFKGNIR